MLREKVQTQLRQKRGKQTRRLRREGILPGNIHGAQVKESIAVQLDRSLFRRLYRTVTEADLLDVVIEGENESRPVLISEVQVDPVTGDPLHVDFRQVDLLKKVEVNVPIEIVGESLAVRNRLGVLLTVITELPIEVLPTQIPHSIPVDISGLTEVGVSITVGQVELPAGAELMTDDLEEVVVKIEAEQTAAEEPVTVEEPAEPAGDTPKDNED